MTDVEDDISACSVKRLPLLMHYWLPSSF